MEKPDPKRKSAQRIATTLPPRSFERIEWLKKFAGFSTGSQILMRGIDMLYAREVADREKQSR